MARPNSIDTGGMRGWRQNQRLVNQAPVFCEGYRFKFNPHVTPDILFMFEAQRMGFVAKVHGDVLCRHLPEFPLAEACVDAGI